MSVSSDYSCAGVTEAWEVAVKSSAVERSRCLRYCSCLIAVGGQLRRLKYPRLNGPEFDVLKL